MKLIANSTESTFISFQKSKHRLRMRTRKGLVTCDDIDKRLVEDTVSMLMQIYVKRVVLVSYEWS